MPPSNRLRGRPRGTTAQGGQTTIQSLDRALDVLDTLASSGGLALSELATQLDQSPSTLYRVLVTLEARDVVEIDPTAQTWHIGAAAFRLGSAFLRRMNVVERSRPVMRALMEETGETANLGVEKSGMVVFVSQVETPETIRAFFPPGTLSEMHASGIGKALLSRYSDHRLASYLRNHPLERFTDNTITDEAALREELGRIRDAGYSHDDEERTAGMRCIAAPVIDIHGEAVAGISVSGPTHRMSEGKIDEVSAKVCEAAHALSRSLGAPAD